MSAADLQPEHLAQRLTTRRFGRSLSVLERTESTNDDARAALLAGAPDGHVVVADHQTRGRGARGRSWQSPAGSDLYLSIVARPDLDLPALPPLTLATGLGVARCLDAFARESKPEIKWPNDVLLDGKKAAGILVETATLADSERPGVVIGIGLNVGRRSFGEVDFPATSLALALGEAPARVEVLAELLNAVEQAVDAFLREGPEATVRAVDARLALRGRAVVAGDVRGTVVGVAADGRLRLSTDGGEQLVGAGRLRPAG